jgi:hypothetical protein
MSKQQMQDWRHECLNHLKLQHPVPIEYFSRSFEP